LRIAKSSNGNPSTAPQSKAFSSSPPITILGKYPLLVVIHGGPTGVDTPVLTADRYYPVERFAAKGALILKPNYRGSAGYGAKFRASMCATSA